MGLHLQNEERGPEKTRRGGGRSIKESCCGWGFGGTAEGLGEEREEGKELHTQAGKQMKTSSNRMNMKTAG